MLKKMKKSMIDKEMQGLVYLGILKWDMPPYSSPVMLKSERIET